MSLRRSDHPLTPERLADLLDRHAKTIESTYEVVPYDAEGQLDDLIGTANSLKELAKKLRLGTLLDQ